MSRTSEPVPARVIFTTYRDETTGEMNGTPPDTPVLITKDEIGDATGGDWEVTISYVTYQEGS